MISGSKAETVERAFAAISSAAAIAGFPVNYEKSCDAEDHARAFNIDFKYGHMEICKDRLEEFQEDIMVSGDEAKSIALVGYVRSVNAEQARSLVDALPRHLSCALHLFESRNL